MIALEQSLWFSWISAIMYVVVVFAAFSVLVSPSYGHRWLAWVNIVASIFGIVGFVYHVGSLFHLGWAIMALAAAVLVTTTTQPGKHGVVA